MQEAVSLRQSPRRRLLLSAGLSHCTRYHFTTLYITTITSWLLKLSTILPSTPPLLTTTTDPGRLPPLSALRLQTILTLPFLYYKTTTTTGRPVHRRTLTTPWHPATQPTSNPSTPQAGTPHYHSIPSLRSDAHGKPRKRCISARKSSKESH